MNHNRPPSDGYAKARTSMRRFGPAMIAIGGLMVLIGFGQFALTVISGINQEPFSGTRPGFPILFVILGFPGMLILGIGMKLTKVGYLKEIAQYGAKETTPAVQTTTTAIRSALQNDDIPCPSCSSPIEPDSKFCSSCGVDLANMKCDSCNDRIDPSDKFCPSCGTPNSLRKA